MLSSCLLVSFVATLFCSSGFDRSLQKRKLFLTSPKLFPSAQTMHGGPLLSFKLRNIARVFASRGFSDFRIEFKRLNGTSRVCHPQQPPVRRIGVATSAKMRTSP